MNKGKIVKIIEDYGLLVNIVEDYISKRDRISEVTSIELLNENCLSVQYTNHSMGYLYYENIEIPINDIITKR